MSIENQNRRMRTLGQGRIGPEARSAADSLVNSPDCPEGELPRKRVARKAIL